MRTLMRSPIESGPARQRETQASGFWTKLRLLPPVRFQTVSSSPGPPMASGLHLRDGSSKRSRTAIFNGSSPPCRRISLTLSSHGAFSILRKSETSDRKAHERGPSIRTAHRPARIQAPATARTRPVLRAGGTPHPKEMIRRCSLAGKRVRTACPRAKYSVRARSRTPTSESIVASKEYPNRSRLALAAPVRDLCSDSRRSRRPP